MFPVDPKLYDARFQTPFAALIQGSSQSGKTFFLTRLLSELNELTTETPTAVRVYYKRMQPLYEAMRNTCVVPITFHYGIPSDLLTTMEQKSGGRQKELYIFDDLLSSIGGSENKTIEELLLSGVHHFGQSVILICQNCFYKNLRTIRLQCHYILAFQSAVDQQMLEKLAIQIQPKTGAKLIREILKTISKPYGYILFDLHPKTPDVMRFRTNILASDTRKLKHICYELL
jgi:hypothetical protein